jgi:hypothetical protein
MEELNKCETAFKKLYGVLDESMGLFYLVLAVLAIGTLTIIANTELIHNSNSFGFYMAMTPMAACMWYTHKKMVSDPLHKAIDTYIEMIKRANLSGDELLHHNLLPTQKMLSRFSKYNMSLQKTGVRKLYQGLSYLNFTVEEAKIDMKYKETVRLIGLTKPVPETTAP